MYTFGINYKGEFFFTIIWLIMTVFFTTFLFIQLYLFIKKRMVKLLFRILCLVFIIISIGITIVALNYGVIYHKFKEYYEIKNMIENNEVNYVEGYVENFSTSNEIISSTEPESFDINNVHFEYHNRAFYGYVNDKIHGGLIKGDNQYIKLGYVLYNDQNIIVYVEMIQ